MSQPIENPRSLSCSSHWQYCLLGRQSPYGNVHERKTPILSESDIGLERFQSRNKVSKRSIRTTAACSSGTLLPLRAVPCFPATDFPPMLGRYSRGFPHQKPTVKDSGLWYGRVAAANRLEV